MRTLTIDTETELIPDVGKVRTWNEPPPLVAWGVCEGDEYLRCVWDDHQSRYLRGLLQDDFLFVFHNAAFDIAVLCRAYPDAEPFLRAAVHEGRVRDTQVLYKLRYPFGDRRTTLDAIWAHLYPEEPPLEKGEERLTFRRDRPVTQAQWDYLERDVRATARLYERLVQIPYGRLALEETPYSRPLGAQSAGAYAGRDPDAVFSEAAALRAWHLERPLLVDTAALGEVATDVAAEVAKHQGALYDAKLMRVEATEDKRAREWRVGSLASWSTPKRWTGGFDGDTPIQYRRNPREARFEWRPGRFVLEQKLLRGRYASWAAENDVTPPLSKKTGELSLEYKFWRNYRERLPEDLQAHLAYAKAAKLQSAFVVPLQEAKARQVCPQYWIPGAETGRWACSKPNLQQLPKAFRRIYRAPEGYRFVTADYKALEIFTLANTMAGLGIRGPLLEALESGDDLHDLTADRMGGANRHEAKMCNFGLPGGMGIATFLRHAFRAGYSWTFEEARDIRARWFGAYPDVAAYMKLFEVDLQEFQPWHMDDREWVESLGWRRDEWPTRRELSRLIDDGRFYTVVLPSGRVIPRRHYAAAANVGFQGPGADVITHAFVLCAENALQIAAVVHDSITVVEKEGQAPWAAQLLPRLMQEALQQTCPLVPAPLPEATISEVLV